MLTFLYPHNIVIVHCVHVSHSIVQTYIVKILYAGQNISCALRFATRDGVAILVRINSYMKIRIFFVYH